VEEGAFGGKETIEILRTAKERWRSLNPFFFFFSILFFFGLHLFLP
jgi:hypothetical protein